ncbi:MAG TPA: gamma-glutamyltransferase [Thermoanaerobaculia bacterium]|nr:gamma-glutamyltransferase [Thermoanaerobaculia bacterium]
MRTRRTILWLLALALPVAGVLALVGRAGAEGVDKPVLHARHWLAITGKPLAATAGAMTFQKGGNAVDAACAMLAATCTMWDTLGWGGETQALLYRPPSGSSAGEVIGVNGLGIAPTGATAEFFRERGERYPPEFGPLAATTPGNPGALMTLLAEYGTLSLAEVLEPAIQLARGFPLEAQLVRRIGGHREMLAGWPSSKAVFLPGGEPPKPGQVFVQEDLARTLEKLVEAEREALAAGKGRKEAIQAAYDRFYRGDIARDLVRGTREAGGLITLEDLDRWRVLFEEPVSTSYKGIDVYKLTVWTQGPVLLQALNLLEPLDLQGMGFNSARYVHALYQAMNLAFADRDFYYGDPYFPPEEPVAGLLSKEYAAHRRSRIDWEENDPDVKPGDPYAFQDGDHPFREYLEAWPPARGAEGTDPSQIVRMPYDEAFRAGTTSIVAADAEGWVVSVTPSGAWVPAFIAGDTGIGLSQRMQSFVVDPAENPYNVVEPGKRPRVTLTPSLALKDGKPYIAFAVQGGDTQDQNLLQYFLNVVEWGMDAQEAAEAPNVTSYQMISSFGAHEIRPGRLTLREDTSPWVIGRLRKMGYDVDLDPKTSGPITAIVFDHEHGTMWGAASDFGEDYGIGW